MSKTISINAGSSSLKWKLFQMPEEEVLASGVVERIGLNDSIFTIKYGDGQKYEDVFDIENHTVAVENVLKQLTELNIIESFDEITGVGHRVVAGGEIFKESTLIDDKVLEQIEDLSEFAPLHNPANASGIRAFQDILPDITSVAVFDTSFHTTMPKQNYLYSVPMKYYTEHNARRYGAHGTSHRYVANRAAEMLGQPIEDLKIVSAHLGNGASLTAIDGGKSVDTSMGFTPLAGVTMGTRSGDVDPSLLQFIMKKEGISDYDEMIDILNNESGLKGLSGVSSDMRDVEEAAESGNEDAQVALDIFNDRVRKYIGQYAATMNGIDVLIFTAGIGENAPNVREEVCDGLSFLGLEIDKEANNVRGEERVLSTDDSKVKVLLIPTDEELMIARDVEALKQ